MEEMNQTELNQFLIDIFVNLQRIKNANDRDTEIEYQLAIAKAKLQAAGIPTERLEMK